MNTFLKACLAGALLLFFFFSCEKDSILETNSPSVNIAPVNQADYAAVDQMFNYLADNPQLTKAPLSTQFSAFEKYADENGIAFDVQQAIAVQENAFDPNQTKVGARPLAEVGVLNDMLFGTGFEPTTANEILEYRKNLAADHKGLSTDEYEAVEDYAQLVEYLANSPGAARYFSITAGESNMADKSIWSCFVAQFAAAAASAACASAPSFFTCGKAAIAWAKVVEECGPGGNEPCYNSLDPCCGNDCGPGYTCIGDGICVNSPGGDSCNGILCPPGTVCQNGNCIEL